MLCPKCEQTLVKPAECNLCGWSKYALAEQSGQPPMPTMGDALDIILHEIEQFRGRRPQDMPQGRNAAHWLLLIALEKHQPEEAPRLVTMTKGKDTVQVWKWPFSTRVKVQSRQFLHCSPDFQRYIIAAKEDGIPWRGDDEEMFRRVVAEHLRMQAMGIAEYRKQAMRNIRVMQDNLKLKSEAA